MVFESRESIIMPIYAIYSIYTQYNLIICMHNCLNDMNGYLSQYLDQKKKFQICWIC